MLGAADKCPGQRCQAQGDFSPGIQKRRAGGSVPTQLGQSDLILCLVARNPASWRMAELWGMSRDLPGGWEPHLPNPEACIARYLPTARGRKSVPLCLLAAGVQETT